MYTILQKKCSLILPNSSDNLGLVTLTLGHGDFVKWSTWPYVRVSDPESMGKLDEINVYFFAYLFLRADLTDNFA